MQTIYPRPTSIRSAYFWYRHYSNLCDGYRELRGSGTALLEITLAACALASGLWVGWPFYHPYASDAYHALTGGLPSWFWGALWVAHGIYQGGIAFFSSRHDARANKALRRNAAAIGVGLWGCVSVVLFQDRAPGWMTAIAPVFFGSHLLIFFILNRSRRVTDA